MNGVQTIDRGTKHPSLINARLLVLLPFLLLMAAVASGCGGSQTGTVQGRVIFKVGTSTRYGAAAARCNWSKPDPAPTAKLSPPRRCHQMGHTTLWLIREPTALVTRLSGNCYGTVTVRSDQTIEHDVICQPAIAVG